MSYPINSNFPIRQFNWNSLLPKTNPVSLTERVVLIAYTLFAGVAAVTILYQIGKRVFRKPNEGERVIQEFLMDPKALDSNKYQKCGSFPVAYLPQQIINDLSRKGITWELNGKNFYNEHDLAQGYEALARVVDSNKKAVQILNALQQGTCAYLWKEMLGKFNEDVNITQQKIQIVIANGKVSITNTMTGQRKELGKGAILGTRSLERRIHFNLAELARHDWKVPSLRVNHRYLNRISFA